MSAAYSESDEGTKLNSSISQRRILVVDDDSFLREWLQESLVLNGYQVETAENGLKALTTCAEYKPDLVLMDAMMPVMDGIEACRKIKESKEGKSIPIIQMTGVKADDETVNKSFDAGCNDFITKPINLTVLERRIETILNGIQAEKKIKTVPYRFN